MQEQWKELKHLLIFKGYEVSNTGKVVKKRTGNELKQYSINGRPITVNIKSYLRGFIRVEVAKLVAQAFIPNPRGYKYVIYKDDNMYNLNADNLEWSEYPRFGKYWIPDKRKEEWRIIEKYPNYMVSNNGRIKQISTGILLYTIDEKTSATVTVTLNSKTHRLSVRKAMAQAFIPNPDNKPHVIFKDNCRDNLFVENLEWSDKAKRSFSMYEI